MRQWIARNFFRNATLALLGLLTLPPCSAVAVSFHMLYSFNGGSDGANPAAAVTVVGSTLYGTTYWGGATSNGTAYSMNLDGSNYQILHTFTAGADGASPAASLTLVGSKLYGTTHWGGGGPGTVYSMNLDGSNYQILPAFFSQTGDESIYAGVTLGGSTLYGVTELSVETFDHFTGQHSGGGGAVYSMNLNGSNFRTLHNFSGSGIDSKDPMGTLILVGSTLYGTTYGGYGGVDEGSVFSMNVDGSNFHALHNFVSGASGFPVAGLTLMGSTLYGTAGLSVFSINLNGSNFRELHDFTGNVGVWAGVTIVGSTLYGSTIGDGVTNFGTVFSMNLNGSNFQTLYSFSGSGGSNPEGNLTLVGTTLFGTTWKGGTANSGTVFQIEIPEPSSIILAAVGFAGLVAWGWRRRRKLGPS